MSEWMWGFLLVLAYIVLNRLSGDDRWMHRGSQTAQDGTPLAPKWLPGRPLWYTSAASGLLALVLLPWQAAMAFGLAYLTWRLPAWGRIFDLERLPDNYARDGVKMDPFESFIAMISFGSDHVAFFWRNLLTIVPGLMLVALTLADWSVGSYKLYMPLRASFPIVAWMPDWSHVLATVDYSLLWVGLAFSVFVLAIYEIAWRLWPSNPIWRAELMTGALWGLMLLDIS